MHLAPRNELYESNSGFVLRTADEEHFALGLDRVEFDELVDALTTGTAPSLSARPKQAISALLAAGHVVGDASTEAVSVVGDGRVASALLAMLGRVDIAVRPAEASNRRIVVSDDSAATLECVGDISCFRDGNLSVVVPRGVRLTDVLMRRVASSRHRRRVEDGYAPGSDGRRLTSPVHPISYAAAEFVAAALLAEIVAPTAVLHRLTAIDLRTLDITRHPILPVPEPPR